MARFCEFENGCDNLVFGTDRNTRKGFCKSHQWCRTDLSKLSISQRAIEKHKEEKSNKSFDNKVKEIVSREEKGDKIVRTTMAEVTAFWRGAASVIAVNPYCWECGDYISKEDYRNSTAHIFPKSIFLSVAYNEWNYLVLGVRCGCHHKTHTLSTFSQMSIFPTAVNRYLKFGNLITENHKYLDLFLDYANQIL